MEDMATVVPLRKTTLASSRPLASRVMAVVAIADYLARYDDGTLEHDDRYIEMVNALQDEVNEYWAEAQRQYEENLRRM